MYVLLSVSPFLLSRKSTLKYYVQNVLFFLYIQPYALCRIVYRAAMPNAQNAIMPITSS